MLQQIMTPAVFAIFAIGLGLVWFHNQHIKAAGIWALGYLCGVIAFSIETAFTYYEPVEILRLAGDFAYLGSSFFLAVGLAVRYSRKIPYIALGGVFLISIGLRYVVEDYSLQAQILCYGCAALQAIAAWTIFPMLKSGRRYILFGIVIAFSAQLFLVPLITVHVMNETLTANSFGDSFFLAVLNFSVALTSVCLATCLFIDLGMDIIRRYREESRTDMLTGLHNRRAFEGLVQEACGSGAETKGTAAFILCDIDHFKAVNDTYGHAIGDLVIKGLAGVLLERCRARDHVGRLGGEEFGVFMPGATLEMAKLAAEGLRMRFEAYRCPHIPDDTVFTASFGVALFEQGADYKSVFMRADANLYAAKNAGRNCVRPRVGAPDCEHVEGAALKAG